MWTQIRLLLYAKNRFEKFARIFSRRHNQTTFSDAGFLGVLRVNAQNYVYLAGECKIGLASVSQRLLADLRECKNNKFLSLMWVFSNLFIFLCKVGM